MTTNFGVLDLRDTTRSQLRLSEVGEDRLRDAVLQDIATFSTLLEEMISSFVWNTTTRLYRYGIVQETEMLPGGEFTRTDLQKVSGSYNVGLPLERLVYGIGWTRDFFRRRTLADLVRQLDAAERADLSAVYKALRRVLFTPTNSTFYDEDADIPVKAALNADSAPIPPYEGQTFNGATHTHYLTSGSASAMTDANAGVIETHLAEHGHFDNFVMYANSANETTIRARSEFVPAATPFIIDPTGKYSVVSQPGDWRHSIGRLRKMEVRIRTWVPSGYVVAFSSYGADNPKNPIGRRLSDIAEDNALHIVSDREDFPLRAQRMEHWIGFGANERTNLVVMQLTASGTYSTPSGL